MSNLMLWCAIAVTAFCGVTTADAQDEVLVELRDGTRYEGVLVRQDASGVVIKIGEIEQTLAASEVVRLIDLPSVRERYADLRRNIADDDADQLLVLARMLRRHGELGLARLELVHILAIDPGHPEANQLKTLVDAEIELQAGRGEGKPRGAPIRADDFPVLTPEEVNLIKVFETDLARPPRLELRKGAIDRLIERYGDHQLMPQTPEGIEALRRWLPRRVLDLLFRLKARDLYGDVEVQGHPRSLERFRDHIHGNWLMRSCATSACHGGAEAGRLWLRTRAKAADATIYTNFLILERFRLADGTPLLNYEEPEASTLFQMALPAERSTRPHPPLPRSAGAWRPPMTGPEDPRMKDAVDWLRSMYTPRPEYPIDYDPPATVADEFNPEVLAPSPGGPR